MLTAAASVALNACGDDCETTAGRPTRGRDVDNGGGDVDNGDDKPTDKGRGTPEKGREKPRGGAFGLLMSRRRLTSRTKGNGASR